MKTGAPEGLSDQALALHYDPLLLGEELRLALLSVAPAREIWVSVCVGEL